MSKKGVLYLLLVALAVVVTIMSLSSNSSNDGSMTAELNIHISGCSCQEYSEFEITWDEEDLSLINVPALMAALVSADSSGAFLCDCSHGEGEKYESVVQEITPRDDGTGIRLTLIKKVWLDYGDVAPNLRDVLDANKTEIFGINDFDV